MRRVHGNISEGSLENRTECRDRIDLLRGRADLLSGKDRVLMKVYLDNGNTFRQMAQIAGVNEANIARRIHRIVRRLLDGEYITILRNRDIFSTVELVVAKDYFLDGLSIKKIAVRQRQSYYGVRKTLKKIQKLVEVLNTSGGRSVA